MGHAHSLVCPWATASEIGMHFPQLTFPPHPYHRMVGSGHCWFPACGLQIELLLFFLVLHSHPMVGADHRVCKCLHLPMPVFCHTTVAIEQSAPASHWKLWCCANSFIWCFLFGMVIEDHSSSAWSNTPSLVFFLKPKAAYRGFIFRFPPFPLSF